ncbi:hypothetical protein GPECTOR_8g61 [Gonium pectorale]|uniref:Uncharacterized protein n=1 Tax=Gonium pectorale TaxID=33097 RepID=A0A150GTR1_GONPE|nr:hypothetical protein GPECTOR_8g61 [Gonium pectorale]|eukprot:KXZ53068.1 hypothetical protein GPECTOR_8g61 [Gonium pectorale]
MPNPSPAVLDRRGALLGALAVFAGAAVDPAQAGVLDGTVEWWKGRKRANSAKLIAPIKVAQQRLEAASAMLANGSGSAVDVLQLVRASSLNCYLFEALPGDSIETRASLVTQSSGLSDPCTFRIVVKNAVDFASPADKERGAELLSSLILAYQKLDSELEAAALDGATSSAAGKATAQLSATLQLAYQVEGFVKEMLLVA